MAIHRRQLSASLEDYLETIFHLSSGGRVARSKDIAEEMRVARPSVTGALRALSSRRLVHYRPYGYVKLTPRGRRQATRVVEKHRIIESFFTGVLGVSTSEAQEAACRAEHALGTAIVNRLVDLMEFMARSPDSDRSWTQAFQDYRQQRRE